MFILQSDMFATSHAQHLRQTNVFIVKSVLTLVRTVSKFGYIQCCMHKYINFYNLYNLSEWL